MESRFSIYRVSDPNTHHDIKSTGIIVVRAKEREREMKLNCKWFAEKHHHWVVKLAISVLFLGLAFRLLFSQSTGFSNVSEAPFIEQKPNPQPVSVDFQENGNQILENGTQYQENGTQVPVNRNPNTSADLQEKGDHSDNATQVSLEPKSSGSDDVQETRDQIPGKGIQISPSFGFSLLLLFFG